MKTCIFAVVRGSATIIVRPVPGAPKHSGSCVQVAWRNYNSIQSLMAWEGQVMGTGNKGSQTTMSVDRAGDDESPSLVVERSTGSERES
jgi:hypothetical protein